MDIRGINSLVLAYLGDAVYEEKIRLYLLSKGINKVNLLQQVAINYVSAKRQAYFLDILLEKEFFNEAEISVIKRARNAKSHNAPKGCDIITYKKATGLEAVIGYFKLTGQEEKINKLIEIIVEV